MFYKAKKILVFLGHHNGYRGNFKSVFIMAYERPSAFSSLKRNVVLLWRILNINIYHGKNTFCAFEAIIKQNKKNPWLRYFRIFFLTNVN